MRVVRLLKNWREALSAEITGTPLFRLEMRNGVIISAPDTVDLAFLFHEIWVRRTYSPPGYEVREGDAVIDVGANIGIFATYAATAARDVTVYCYEPFPGNVAWLQKNLAESDLSNVRIYEQAVAANTGERVLHVSSSWIMHSLLGDQDSADDLPVKCVSLDQILENDTGGRCDLLKLDCEGCEYEILMNCGSDTLRCVKRIVGEYHENDQTECSGEQLRKFLESRSFRVDYCALMGEGSGLLCATNTQA